MRLDEYLVTYKKIASRNQANSLIRCGFVLVNKQKVLKSHKLIAIGDIVEVIKDDEYVSRAAYKLIEALEVFKIDVKDKIVLDIGASTGGFSEVCLRRGAKMVYCVDVGQNQLHPKIANNPKVINYEKSNIKDLTQAQINHSIDLVVSDLSFISSKYMFISINQLQLNTNVDIISLIKPQFELTPKILTKHRGVVKEEKYHQLAIAKVSEYAKQSNFRIIKVIESPILGAKKGNKEFLLWAQYE